MLCAIGAWVYNLGLAWYDLQFSMLIDLGLSIAMAMRELSTRQIISGTTRMAGALVTALRLFALFYVLTDYSLGFGITAGATLVFWVDPGVSLSKPCEHPIDPLWLILWVPVTISGRLSASTFL